MLGGYQKNLMSTKSNFHKITYKSFLFSLFFLNDFFASRQGINIFNKIKPVLTMPTPISLRTVGYHLAVLTNRVLLVFERV